MQYLPKVLDALEEFSEGETYQYNIKLLSPLGLIETKGRNLTTGDNGLIAGWSLSDEGKKVLRENAS